MVSANKLERRVKAKEAKERQENSATVAAELAADINAEADPSSDESIGASQPDTPPPSDLEPIDEGSTDVEKSVDEDAPETKSTEATSSCADLEDDPVEKRKKGKSAEKLKKEKRKNAADLLSSDRTHKPPAAVSSRDVTAVPTLTHNSSSLQVFAPVSRFTDVATLKSISLDLLDLLDENDDSDEDQTKTLVELLRANKKRRRRLLKSVKQFSKEREDEKRENEKRKKKEESYVPW